MAVSKVFTISLNGIRGEVVEIEVDLSDGLPSYTLLGLPDSALSESRDRVRSALVNSGFAWPNQRITVSMSPAWLPKAGSHFDLPIAVGILLAQQLIQPSADHEDLFTSSVFMGELGLGGEVRPMRGALPALLAATRHGFTSSIIPRENSVEAQALTSMNHFSFENLKGVISFLRTGEYSEPDLSAEQKHLYIEGDFSEVAGQKSAKFAAEVAATGRHHLFLVGPPGTGKSMIASRIPTIMPSLSPEEALEVSSIHSIAGGSAGRNPRMLTPPFIAPHHSISQPALVGGGSQNIKPGAISLAHHGVLFIDEAPESKPGLLESLREPLERGEVLISRASGTVSYPSKFLLVLAANPCPCGKYVGKALGCLCTPTVIKRYSQRISGPLKDRIDIRTTVDRPTRVELAQEEPEEASVAIRNRVEAARKAAEDRFDGEGWSVNADIPPTALRKRFAARKDAMALLHTALDLQLVSARGFHKTLRVAWTVADLAGRTVPEKEDVERALVLRMGDI